MGGLEHAGEARWGGGPARWPQVHLGSHGGPREYDGGEEIGLQPLGYGLDCKRGRSVVPQKGISPPPITADPRGGGWEACNRAVTAGVGQSCEVMNLSSSPHPAEQSLSEEVEVPPKHSRTSDHQ